MNYDKEMQELAFYKEECAKLKKENVELETKLTFAERQRDEAETKLAKIKGSFAWKLSKPLRVLRVCYIHWSYYKTPKKILQRYKNKKLEKKAHEYLGLKSFPDENERKIQESYQFKNNHRISILVPLYNTPEKFLREMIESVLYQTYAGWELCLADGSDEQHTYVGEICREYAAKDARIVYKKLESNEGISGNTNQCYKLATGDYIGLFDHDDILHPSVLFEYMKAIEEKNADYVYCDEVTFTGDSINNMITLHFKPDYALDTLRANNYICHFSVFKKQLLQETELFRKEYDGSQDHDMILRLTSLAGNVIHVPRILYYWRAHAGSVASNIEAKLYCIDSAKRAIEDHLQHYGIHNTQITSTRAFETIFRLKYDLTTKGKVSIILPRTSSVDSFCRCVENVIKKNTYDCYEIIVVEKDEENISSYGKLLDNPVVRVVSYRGGDNLAAMYNYGVKEAEGEFLLLLDDKIDFIGAEFVQELLMYAQRDDIGAVGAKLLYPGDTICHAGIVIGLGAERIAGYIHHKYENEHIGYMGRLCYAQNTMAVSGAALMIKKMVYEECGGYDERLSVCLKDVDLCLRLRQKGLLNIFTPFAEAYHDGLLDMGLESDEAVRKEYLQECDIFRERWKKLLAEGDPYYNPNFTMERSDYSLNMPKN